MPSTVTFASARPKELRASATLPALLDRMLARWNLKKRFGGKRTAIKMHLGGHLGFSTIHPLLARHVVQAVIAAGGKPFVTDSPGAVASAASRGYTAETLGCPLLPVAGAADRYIHSKRIGYRTLKTVELAGEIMDAEAMIVLSHGKGHGQSGFGGAIKNIAMGCVDGPTRSKIHRLQNAAFRWDPKKCTRCGLCRDNCPNEAITIKDGKVSIFDHTCKYCMHCVRACEKGALSINPGGYEWFQMGMALTTREVLRGFEAGRVLYVTALLSVTPFCDCWGFTTPAIVPDIGILASDDIVSIETAALDLIKVEDFIEGSLPPPLKRTGGGHLFQQIHGKDPALQIAECAKLKMGSRKYKLVEVR